MTEAIVKSETKLTVGEAARIGTDIAGVCGAIVQQTAMQIGKRKYVKVEGWQAIASAAGCGVSVVAVNEELNGFTAWAEVRRLSDNALVGRAEGYVGDDEDEWSKKPVYAKRAMAQTRATSRACRSAFAFIVVLIDANLSTTPAEEVPSEGFDEPTSPIRPPSAHSQRPSPPAADFAPNKRTTGVKVPFGREKGKDLAEIDAKALSSLGDYLQKQVADPNKENYRARNQQLLDAVVTEGIARGKSQA